MKSVTLDPHSNYVYTLFVWSASDCSPNRDGGTGAIRTDQQHRVFITQESFNQNIKNGLFFRTHGFGAEDGNLPPALLMGCKNEFFGPRTLRQALESVRDNIAEKVGKEGEEITGEHLFNHCFDIPLFGYVNSNGLEHPAFPHNLPGSAGLLYLPKTINRVSIENRGISNSFSQPKSDKDHSPKGMPGSHFTDYLVEGVFVTVGILNASQLRVIAKKKFGMEDPDAINKRVEELYNLYLAGIWEGYKLLGYASTMRKGQQPVALYSLQLPQLPDYISNPADALFDENGQLPLHESITDTLKKAGPKLAEWSQGGFGKSFSLVNGQDFLN